jgi:hypothetical protein
MRIKNIFEKNNVLSLREKTKHYNGAKSIDHSPQEGSTVAFASKWELL